MEEVVKCGSYVWGGYGSAFLEGERLGRRVMDRGGWEEIVGWVWGVACWRVWEVGEGGEEGWKVLGDMWVRGRDVKDWDYKNRGHSSTRSRRSSTSTGSSSTLISSSSSPQTQKNLKMLAEAYTLAEVHGLTLEPNHREFYELLESTKTKNGYAEEKESVVRLLRNLGVESVQGYDPRSSNLAVERSEGLSGLSGGSLPGFLEVDVYVEGFGICIVFAGEGDFFETGERGGMVKIKVGVLKELGFRVTVLDVRKWREEGFCGRIEMINECMFGCEEGKSLGLGGRIGRRIGGGGESGMSRLYK
ncbi:hypothetical protein TrVE_jg9620 [Triparma verrucosa]|nr:hypothetical protein TrVE_jg9620 [Triparma verrucosa]